MKSSLTSSYLPGMHIHRWSRQGSIGYVMAELIKNAVHGLNGFIWGPGMLVMFLTVGILFTVRTGFFQFTHIRLWMGRTIVALFRNRNVRKTDDEHAISQFQSFCTALAATLGTGNITGVATAIIAGGPGAIFWMWVSALLGMMTNFAENILGIRYRRKNSKGEWTGGAMLYIEKGLHCPWLAAAFAFLCILASLGMGNMTQANSMAVGLKEAFSVPPVLTGVLSMAAVGLVLLGGVKRLAKVTEKVVPFMAVFYLAGGIFVLAVHWRNIPQAFSTILTEAFQLRSVGGGVLGYGMRQAMKMGIARGIFSNEAGLGSSVMAHIASDVKEPVVQGMWGIFEVFADTVVVCTITALVILTSGVYDKAQCLSNIVNGIENIDGTTLTGLAFETAIPGGSKFMAAAIVLFAFATIVGWSYFGVQAVTYLLGERYIRFYKLLYILVILPGCVTAPGFIWELADTMNGCMAIPNLIAITLLSGEVTAATRKYLNTVQKEQDSA